MGSDLHFKSQYIRKVVKTGGGKEAGCGACPSYGSAVRFAETGLKASDYTEENSGR
jgi:hypothetical protein